MIIHAVFLPNNQTKFLPKYSGMDGVVIFKLLNKQLCVLVYTVEKVCTLTSYVYRIIFLQCHIASIYRRQVTSLINIHPQQGVLKYVPENFTVSFVGYFTVLSVMTSNGWMIYEC
jgi:hypothetical protein